MSDDLALAVGKIILAWGKLDQQLHVLIRASERQLGDPYSKEGRFTERRKIFRRLSLRLAGDDDSYKRRFDKVCAALVGLERKRGRIAHGYADQIDDGAFFLDVPGSFDEEVDKVALSRESYFTFPALAQLELDIRLVADSLVRLSADAFVIWKRENGSAPLR
jgi:hypothetical protein